MKKILFIILLVCMIFSCSDKSTEEPQSKEEEIYQTSGINDTIKYLEKMAKTDPKNKAFYLARMGYYYIEEKDYKNAEDILKKALETDQDMAFIHNEMGYLYGLQGKKELSLESYIKGTESKEEMVENFYGAGSVYLELGKFKEAESYLRKAAALYENRGQAGDKIRAGMAVRSLYVAYRNTKDIEEVKAFINDSISKNLDKSYLCNQMAYIYYGEGKFTEALKYNLDGIKADPEYPDNYFGAGVISYHKGDKKKALEYIGKVALMYKKDNNTEALGSAYAFLYKINIEEGNRDKADEIEAAAQQELGKENWEKKKI